MKRKICAIHWILIVLLMLVVTRPDLATTHAQQSNRAGLVVRFGDGSLTTYCVEFTESTISGYDLLTRSGLNIVAAFGSGQGAAVCKIDGTGCPVESCLTCDIPNYWSYWHLVDGAWAYSQAGSGSYTVGNGDVEGWSWGNATPPSVVPFDQICASPPTDTPDPTNTPTPTNTPIPPTSTPVPPTATPTSQATPSTPTATPPPPTPEAWFRLDNNPIAAGSCTNVRWDTSNAQTVYLDGEDVSANGSREICPTAPQEYTLRLVNAAGDQTYTLVLGVTGAAPTGTFTPQPAAAAASATPTKSPQSIPTATISQSDATHLQATATLPPSPDPATQPAASPLPSPTPARQAALSLVAAASDAQPAPTQPALPTAEPATGEDSVSVAVPIGYIVFSLTAGGLLGWLVFAMQRRK